MACVPELAVGQTADNGRHKQTENITLTMNTHGHLLESMKRGTADQMDAILKPVAVKTADRVVN